jgi:hypothetical protein
MNESTLTQLKITVERAVRPLRASTHRKRKIREELLAHVSEVFEEELGQGRDERAALERTAQRFGDAAAVTAQLQGSVPAGDRVMRFLEGEPGESSLRSALRVAWLQAAVILVALGAAIFAAGWQSAWSSEELIAVASSSGFLPMALLGPLWLFGTALVTGRMEKSLQGSEPLTGWPRIGLKKSFTSAWAVPAVRAALIVGGGCLLVLACIGGFTWPLHRADWKSGTVLAALPFAGAMAAASVLCAWGLVQTVAERRRYHAEWAGLPISGEDGAAT